MITAEKLTRKYGETVAVNAVSFTIKRGEIVGLLGHNGAGKTTIMKIITGYLEPTAGTVYVDDLNVLENRLKVQAKIGYLPENCPLYPEMEVLDFLEYAARLKGVPEAEIPARVRTAVQKTRLEEMAFRQVNTLSRGYRQRLGVAQAILNSASILILDEPTNGLDPSQILEMRTLINELAQTSTIVISTHILQEVQAVCSRVLIINRGRLALDASMSELRPTNRISVVLDKPESVVGPVLQAMSGVTLLENSEKAPERFEYIIDLDQNLNEEAAPEVAKRLVQNDFRLFSLQQHIRDLETIFAEISSGKEPAPDLVSNMDNPEVSQAETVNSSAPVKTEQSSTHGDTITDTTGSDSSSSGAEKDSNGANTDQQDSSSQDETSVNPDSSDSISMKDGR
ncbi:MAG: ABC transporter ATP-binding protein [Cyanobacteria bacterium]|nr:ABC transporter ATP-binding protein [Cyanobacteriota bacterium]